MNLPKRKTSSGGGGWLPSQVAARLGAGAGAGAARVRFRSS